MAAEFKLGRLRYNWVGTWTPGNAYSRDDIVLNDGKAYACLIPSTASANFYTDLYATFPVWAQVTDGKTWAGPWLPNHDYGTGHIVIFGGKAYSCSVAHQSGSLFETNTANWTEYTEFSGWHQAWVPGTEYGQNDVVRWGGIVYKCITNHVAAGSTDLGLEANQAAWTVYYSGINYTGNWQANSRYKANDLVKVDGNIYICTTYNKDSTFTVANWSVWLPGQEFNLIWTNSSPYQLGDAVVYGGNAYVSKVANNLGNNPDDLNSAYWSLFNQGYSIRGEWAIGTTYSAGDLVTRDGVLYEATAVSTGQDPAILSVSTTYTASGSSGTTLKVNDTTSIAVGMIVSGTGFRSGQFVSSITNSQTVVLDRAPSSTLVDGQILYFGGVNTTSWMMLLKGNKWTNIWSPTSNYTIGDVVKWSKNTYSCIQSHTSASSVRPDTDANNVFWIVLVANNQNNSITTYGDIETFDSGAYTPIFIGPDTYNLRVNVATPNWQKINIIPSVYYVDTYTGIDREDYGLTWDQPWKTIRYSCDFIGQGLYFANASAALQANKGWLITEMYQWMVYQTANNISPFTTDSLFDAFYTQRDAGYFIDSVIYDMQRGGNSQVVAATLRLFYYGSKTQLANSLIESAINYFPPSLTYLTYLMSCVVQSQPPAQSYQTLNGITGSDYIHQSLSGTSSEFTAVAEITSLMNIVITATTNQNTYAVPSSNSGLTAILNIKTGTYNEMLPIVVPENLSIVGDELRSVTVQPATSIKIYCSQINSNNNSIIVNNTIGLEDEMPMQFISPYVNNASTTFGGVTSGETYYINGSSITETSFTLLDAPTVSFVGTLTQGSNVISNVSKISNLKVGQNLTGTGIPNNTVVTSISQVISGISTVTMSNQATVNGISAAITASGNTVTVTDGTGSMLIYAGDCLKNMWLMRNGTTMRNLSNFGLLGTLTQANQYGTARPTGGAYTSLDPGNGPDDSSAWIIRRSPYIQNVTNFGDGCVGSKVDGDLHNGGSKSMLHNDYTQVLSDGIGVWINADAISECVSVFSYYCYIGHFASNGGRIRSTNGNSSYGTFGVVSEGYNMTEVPIPGTIFNQSSQVQASVTNAFGTADNILKLNYSNAGSAYYLPATNMIQYSNNFVAPSWINDGNISFIKNETAPTGYTEAWLLTGSSSTPGTGYVQQSISINPSGYSYTNISGVTQNSAPGNGATFDITVTNTAYVVTIHTGSAGTLYQSGNQILIKGSVLGGIDGVNDLTITVGNLAGTGIGTIASTSGIVPAGSSQNYTLSMYVFAGTSATVDLQAIFSGISTVTSGISYNVSSNVVTPYGGQSLTNSLNAGTVPVFYGSEKTLVSGWYKVWLAVSDAVGTNNTLTFKFFPQGANNPVATTYSIFYGAQLELSGSSPAPDFYLETTVGMYTAYANYQINGAGSGAVLLGDEVRSQSVFNARVVTDANGFTGGAGYATSNNTAQAGNGNSVQLSQADQGLYNYLGMRVFIQSGTGAGQFGYVSYYNGTGGTDANGILSKTALIVKESFESLGVVTTTYSSTPANNLITLATGTDISKLYVNQAVQFLPTYYTSTVTSTSVDSVTAISTSGGADNYIVVDNVEPLAINMPVTFVGSGFNLTAGYQYYIVNIDYTSAQIQISATISGDPIELSTIPADQGITMLVNYPRYSGYFRSSTANMIPNILIEFTGVALGGVTLGTPYYINDIIDGNNFTVSAIKVTLASTATIGGSTNIIRVASTSGLVPLNPVVFSGNIFDSAISPGTSYYISNILANGTDFQISTAITRATVLSTEFGTNLITLDTVTNFVVGQPILFSGIAPNTTFGNIVSEATYYIQTINNVSKQITVSTDKTNTFVLTSTGGALGGQILARTCPVDAAVQLGSGTGSMIVSSTGTKLAVTNSVGNISTMNATFSTSLYGNLNSYTTYYVTAITAGTNPQLSVSLTKAGTPITLSSGVGAMQLAASGWDNINPGTPAAVGLDSTSVYFIEPRVTFTPPPSSQSAGGVSIPLSGAHWQDIAYGNNYFLAIPNNGATGGQSSDGKNWTQLTLPASVSSWTSITYGNFYWIALGTASGSSVAAYSNSSGLGWRTSPMPSTATWNKVAYGNGIFVAIATGSNKAAYTTTFGASWIASTSTLLASKTWVGLSYGTGVFLAIASDGTGAWSYDGNTWQATQLPQSTVVLSGIIITGGAGTFTCDASGSLLVVGQQVVVSGTNTGSGTITNGTYLISATNGKTSFTLTDLVGAPVSTGAGSPTQKFTVGAPSYTSLSWGNNKFLAVQSGNGLYSAFSFNGIQWYQSSTYLSATAVTYGQGVFVAVNSSNSTTYNTDDGIFWKSRSLTYGNIQCINFGYNASNIGVFTTLSNTGVSIGDATVISEGARPQGRATVNSGVISTVTLWETGSNYGVAPPTLAFIDYNSQVTAQVTARISNGTLSNPTFVSRGTGYNTTSTAVRITGNGYADTYQTGFKIVINNLASLPLVGSNLSITGNSQVYKVTSATAVYGTQAPYIEANVEISPEMSTALSPANGTAVSLRQLYSQCRLTNHDFLLIGTGNRIDTNYPRVDETTAKMHNQAVETHQGHVFYTSTDEQGNFEVGGLFGVEQSTGTVTLSATQFGLIGLQTLSLGGIAVGSSSVVITQFSTDPTFVANSDTIISTQRAIKSYLTGRLSQGGANTYTGNFVAGTVSVGNPYYIKSTVTNGQPGSSIKVPNRVMITKGVDGDMAALDFFMRNGNHR